MKTVTIEKISEKRYLFVLRDNEVLREKYAFDPSSAKSQQAIAKAADVAKETVLAWIDNPGTFTLSVAAAGFQVYYRPLKSPRGEPTEFSDALGFLTNFTGTRETIVEWADEGSLGCLDVDYHEGTPPSREWLEAAVLTKLLPRPHTWHFTPRGLHAFYPAVAKLKGAEAAALAALKWRSIDPTAGVEIKRQLRCPGDEKLHTYAGYFDLATFAPDMFSQATTDPETWLESEGLEIGQRYDHDKCPIEPTGATDNRKPVTVGDGGIYCHRCAGLGRSLGRHRPGWVPFSALCGDRGTDNYLGSLVRHKAHWGHAKHVLDAAFNLTGEVAKQGYSAAVKLLHGDCEGVFNPVTDKLVRLDGRWATVEEGYTFGKDITPILTTLPVAQSSAAACLLAQPTIDLADFGYPSVQIIRGCKLSTHVLGSSRLLVASPASWLREYGTAFYPRYVAAGKRMPREEAWATLESVLPKINRKYVETLLVARGCNEAQVGLPQHLFVSGYSKTGKTSHVQLASGILGDQVTPVPASQDLEKFRSAVRDASAAGTFLCFDEYIKDVQRLNPKMSLEQVFEPLLNFDPNSLSHKMYLGPTALGRVGVCVWTEPHFPAVIKDYTQVARRAHVFKLSEILDWDTCLAAQGLSEVRQIRIASPAHAEACNALLSYVADDHFQYPLTFHQLCKKLGVALLDDCEDFLDLTEKRRELFDLVCKAPPLDPEDAKRWPGKGYKAIVRNGDDALSETWSLFSDTGKEWYESKRIREKPFGKILGVDLPIEVDIMHHGNRMAIRFRVGSVRTPEKVNEEITAL